MSDEDKLKAKVRELRAEKRNLKANLTRLVNAAASSISVIDGAMKGPSTVERGRLIAGVVRCLEIEKDAARRYGLGLNWDGTPLPKSVRDAGRRAKKPHGKKAGKK